MINKISKKINLNKKPIYLSIYNILGIYKYKSKLIFNLCNNYFNKKHINFNKINLECINYTNKHSSINTNLFKINSIKFYKKRLEIIVKNINENKNFNKKIM